MNKMKKIYEPPKMKIYQFDENDQILTASSGSGGGSSTTDPTNLTADYAARALNNLMGGTNTTIE